MSAPNRHGSKLRTRIVDTGTTTRTAMGQYHPYGTSATPLVMPVQLVTIGAGDVVGVQDVQPIYAPDGEIIAATAPGSWGQLRAAGRP
jgi:hypothetical protein